MSKTLMVQFYLKEPSAPDSLIMMRIYDAQFKNGIFKYSTRERIETSKWDRKNGMPKGNTTLNKVLLELEADASDYIRLNKRTGYTRETLRDHLTGLSSPTPIISSIEKTMLEEWDEYQQSREGTTSPFTLKTYKGGYNAFCDFAEENKISGITPQKFDLTLYRKFMAYLKKRFSPNTAARHLKTLKMFLKDTKVKIAFDRDEITFKETAGVQIALTEDELEKLKRIKLESKFLNNVRWLFILHCNTGLRISDFGRLDQNINGNFITFETKKVKGKKISQPITSEVREILERYDYKLPKVCEPRYRRGIKEVYKKIAPDKTIQIRYKKEDGSDGFKTVPVWKEISSHDAVRTFVSLCARRGVPFKAISSMTGKTEQVLLKHYLVSSLEQDQADFLAKFDRAPIKSPVRKKRNQTATLSLGL